MINEMQMKEMADVRVSVAMEQYKKNGNNMSLYCALNGSGQYKLESKPNAGHNYYYILDAIYRYYKQNPTSGIDIYLLETLLFAVQYVRELSGLSRYINIISAQIKNQTNDVSPFDIDVIKILVELKNTIMSHENLKNDSNFMKKVSEYDEYLNSNYGHKIL